MPIDDQTPEATPAEPATPEAKPKPKPRSPKNIALAMMGARDEGQQAYQEADALFVQLLKKLGEPPAEGHSIDLGSGMTLRIFDPFIDPRTGQARKAWKPAGFGRWDYEIKSGKRKRGRPKD